MKCDGRHDKNYHDMVAMDYKDIIVLDYYHDDSIAIWNNKIITSLQRVLLFVTLIIESWNQPSGKKGSCIFCKFGSRLPLFSLKLPLLLLKVAITSATLISKKKKKKKMIFFYVFSKLKQSLFFALFGAKLV